jgi:predicted secreted protein
MATQVQLRRGSSSENDAFTGALGEVTVDTTNDTLRVHDGSTAGGFQSAKLTGTQNLTLNNQADLRFGDSDGSHYVALQAPATVSSNLTFTLPAADGTSGQAMVTDASGNLSFAAAGATISADTSTNTDFLLYFAATTSGALTAVKQDSGLLYNPSTGTLTSAAFTGVASSAKYADLAERYTADSNYQSGTVLVFGGNEEVTESTQRLDKRIAGIVSTDPAYLMNSALENSVAVGLQGRVPCKVVGEIRKGDLMVSSATPGHAEAWLEDSNPPTGCVIGKALENKIGAGPDVIEVVVGRI